MNFNKYLIFAASVFGCILPTCVVHAKSCDAGKFFTCGACYDCRSGCYCTGYHDGTANCNSDWTNVCSRTDSDYLKKIENNGKNISVFLCPDAFPNSEKKSKKIEECFTYGKDNVKLNYNTEVKCEPGYYIPAGTKKCDKPCTAGHACEGGTFYIKEIKDLGIISCPNATGKKANDKRTACVDICQEEGTKYGGSGKGCVSICTAGFAYDKETKQCVKSVVCDAGTYLPNDAEICVDCKLGYACPGGEFAPKPNEDMGTTECEINSEKVSEDKTQCITTGAYCEPGTYLPGGRQECKPCSGKNKYCPGGNFGISDYDQGIADCPFNGRPTGETESHGNTGCNVTISKDVMRFGINGLNKKSELPLMDQCWTRSNINDFKDCIFGKIE